jgi:hypothetical protein
MVDYAPPDSPGLRATPDSIEIPMVIRHSLRASATSVGVQVGKTGLNGQQTYYLFLTCRPTDALVFDPGVSQPAMCKGSERREGTDLAIRALLERRVPSPLPAYSFMSREADLYGDYFRINDDARAAAMRAAASSRLTGARCKDLGNCEQVSKARAAARLAAARPGVLTALAIAVFVLASFTAHRVPASNRTGWFVSALSVFVILTSVAAIAVMFPATAPGLGLEGFLYYGFLIFGLVPYLTCVGIIGASMSGGGATRLKAFALALGLLTPVAVWGSIVVFAT